MEERLQGGEGYATPHHAYARTSSRKRAAVVWSLVACQRVNLFVNAQP